MPHFTATTVRVGMSVTGIENAGAFYAARGTSGDGRGGPAALGRELLTLPPAGHAAGHRREGATLHRVVQEFELEALIHPAQDVQDELIREPGVLGKEGAVQVGAVGVQPACTLGTVFAVIAVTHNHIAERFQVLAKVCATAMILEADYLACLAGLGRLNADQHVPDQALLVSLPGLRVQVEDAYAGELLAFGRLVRVAHELVATAHPEDYNAILHDSPQVPAFGAREIFCEQRLFPVLAAAKEEEITAGRTYLHPETNVNDLHGNAPPLAALLDGDNISPVTVQVHHVGVKVVDGEFGPSHGITPFVASPAAPTVISRVPSAWTAARSPSIA